MKKNDIIKRTKAGSPKAIIFKLKNFQTTGFLNFRIGVILLTILTLSFQSCTQGNEKAGKPKAKKVPLVEIQPAQKSRMVSSIDITGTIEANVFTHIKSPAGGTINMLSVRENEQVEKNRIIAVINPTEREALISENRLQVQQIESKLETTDQNSEEYQATLDKLRKAKSNLEYAKNMYQTVSVISPMSGLVTQRYLDEGSQVGIGEKMLTISDMNSLVIKASVNEKYFEAIEKGKTLRVMLNAYPNDTLTGRISLVYPQIDPQTRSVNFDIKILNFNKKLLPGMMASVKIPVSVKENAVVIPEHAVLTSPDNKNFIYIADDDSIAHRRVVHTGIASGNKLEITKGLQINEKVVVAGQEMLKDGMKVKIVKNK